MVVDASSAGLARTAASRDGDGPDAETWYRFVLAGTSPDTDEVVLAVASSYGCSLLEDVAPRKVPGTPGWFMGFANHRGTLVPVMDLHAYCFGLPGRLAPVLKRAFLLGRRDARVAVPIEDFPVAIRGGGGMPGVRRDPSLRTGPAPAGTAVSRAVSDVAEPSTSGGPGGSDGKQTARLPAALLPFVTGEFTQDSHTSVIVDFDEMFKALGKRLAVVERSAGEGSLPSKEAS